MPIGKNSIKRVANNGYSNVKTNAPDMQNSTVIANLSEQVAEVMLPKTEPEVKAASPEKKKFATKKTVAKKTETALKEGFIRCSFGEELPIYLL